jgi:hypothetical protein
MIIREFLTFNIKNMKKKNLKKAVSSFGKEMTRSNQKGGSHERNHCL